MFKELTLTHAKGKLTIMAPKASRENCYIQSVKLNGKPYEKNWFTHDEIFNGNNTFIFEMSSQPNPHWGSSKESRPPSLSDKN